MLSPSALDPSNMGDHRIEHLSEGAGNRVPPDIGFRKNRGEYHLDARPEPRHMPRQSLSVDFFRHDDIAEQESDFLALQQRKRAGRAFRLEHPVTKSRKRSRPDATDRSIDRLRSEWFRRPLAARQSSALSRPSLCRRARAADRSEGGADAGLAIDVDVAARLLDEAEHHAEVEPGSPPELGDEGRAQRRGPLCSKRTEPSARVSRAATA